MDGVVAWSATGWPAFPVQQRQRMTFADFLRALMDERGLNQSQVAVYADVGKSTVSYWLRGSEPKTRSVDRLCAALGLDRGLVRDIVDGRVSDPGTVQEAALTVRVDDPQLASSFRRMMRWGRQRVAKLERIGQEMYDDQVEYFIEALPDGESREGKGAGI